MNSRLVRLIPVLQTPFRIQLQNFKTKYNVFIRSLTYNIVLKAVNTRASPAIFDWTCHKCDHINFSKRLECQKCGESKSKTAIYQNSIQPKLRGDWHCKHCNYHNFANRKVCNSCQIPRTSDASVSVTKSQYIGDWICPNCEYQNFEKRLDCRKCGQLKK